MDDADYDEWWDWHLRNMGYYDPHEVEYQQEVKEYPLFFWKETCHEI